MNVETILKDLKMNTPYLWDNEIVYIARAYLWKNGMVSCSFICHSKVVERSEQTLIQAGITDMSNNHLVKLLKK